MEEEKRKPIEIVCPYCDKKTMVICRETRSGWDEGILYGLDCDFEETDCHHNYIGWEYRCYACNYGLDLDEIEELMNPADPIPPETLTEQLQMEGGIDLFEGYWEKDQSQGEDGSN